MTIDTFGASVESVPRAKMVHSDLEENNGRAQERVTKRRSGVASVVAFVRKDDVGRHFDLAAEKLPGARYVGDESRVDKRTEAQGRITGERVARPGSHRGSFSTLTLLMPLLVLAACGDDATPDASQDTGAEDAQIADGGDAGGEDAQVEVDAATDAFDGGPPSCDEAIAVRSGSLAEEALDELSGLVASRTQPGIYFAINDSGPPDLFAIDETGAALARYRLDGASNFDFEDIAIGPGPGGGDYVYVGDVGDNMARIGGTPRDEVQVYAVPEPIVGESLSTLTDVLTYHYTYDVPVDVEAIAIDDDGSLLMLTKENDTSRLLTAPLQEGPTQMEELGAQPFVLVTAMDFSPAGLAVRTYADIYHFAHLGDAATSFAGEWRRGRPGAEFQGEAIAWRADGTGFVTVPEGVGAPVHVYECR